jgi:hypothetical protein
VIENTQVARTSQVPISDVTFFLSPSRGLPSSNLGQLLFLFYFEQMKESSEDAMGGAGSAARPKPSGFLIIFLQKRISAPLTYPGVVPSLQLREWQAVLTREESVLKHKDDIELHPSKKPQENHLSLGMKNLKFGLTELVICER